jgi:hypothetical protein
MWAPEKLGGPRRAQGSLASSRSHRRKESHKVRRPLNAAKRSVMDKVFGKIQHTLCHRGRSWPPGKQTPLRASAAGVRDLDLPRRNRRTKEAKSMQQSTEERSHEYAA